MQNSQLVDRIVEANSEYVPMDDESMTYLARDVLCDQVFGSWMVPESDLHVLPHIFLTLSLFDDIEIKRMKRDGIVHFYGYRDDAIKGIVDGYPCFTELFLLDRVDSHRLYQRIRDIRNA